MAFWGSGLYIFTEAVSADMLINVSESWLTNVPEDSLFWIESFTGVYVLFAPASGKSQDAKSILTKRQYVRMMFFNLLA